MPTHYLNKHAKIADSINPTTKESHSNEVTQIPQHRDPCLAQNNKYSHPIKYINIFIDDFIAIYQGKKNLTQVRSAILHVVDEIFRSLDKQDSSHRKELISLKKLQKGKGS